eukprot:5091797-Amphidinium_carterae.1
MNFDMHFNTNIEAAGWDRKKSGILAVNGAAGLVCNSTGEDVESASNCSAQSQRRDRLTNK